MSNFLTDSAVKKTANQRAEERKQLRAKRIAQVHRQAQYTDGKKIEAIKTYLALGGNATLTAASLGISRETIFRWKRSNWWNEVITNLRKEEKLVLSAKTKRIMEASMEQLADRLSNGDHVYNQKTGELIRKPLVAKDLHKITTDMMDRADKLDAQTEEKKEIVGESDKLASLAERFAALAVKAAEKNARITSDDIVDVEVREIGNS